MEFSFQDVSLYGTFACCWACVLPGRVSVNYMPFQYTLLPLSPCPAPLGVYLPYVWIA